MEITLKLCSKSVVKKALATGVFYPGLNNAKDSALGL